MKYALVVLLLSGCAGLPVSRATLQDYKVEQADADAEQSMQIASVAKGVAKVAEVVVAIAPAEQKPMAGVILGKVDETAALASAMARAHTDYAAEQAEAKARMDAEPGLGDTLGGAMTGDWSGVLNTILAMASTYLVSDKLRMNSRFKNMAANSLEYVELPPEEARKKAANDPYLKKYAAKKT